jgi:hypothetical protein
LLLRHPKIVVFFISIREPPGTVQCGLNKDQIDGSLKVRSARKTKSLFSRDPLSHAMEPDSSLQAVSGAGSNAVDQIERNSAVS